MKNYTILFPGQGSQSIGMMDSFSTNTIVKSTFDEAAEHLKKDFWSMVALENSAIHQTENTQPIMLISGIALWRLLGSLGINKPISLAGHSLGEFTALVAAGVISFTEALDLVTQRAKLMQSAVPDQVGAMAAILGLEDEAVVRVCQAVQSDEVMEPVNFNSPGQVVIAGHRNLIEQSLDSFKEAWAKRAILLPVSVPSHCSLMIPASNRFREFLAPMHFNAPELPIIHNVDGQSYNQSDDIKEALIKQLFHPVQWTQSIASIISQGTTTLIECGPGKVLTGLNKRMNKEGLNLATDNLEAMHTTIDLING